MFNGSLIARVVRFALVVVIVIIILLLLGEIAARVAGQSAGRTLPELRYDTSARVVQPAAKPKMEVDRRGYWVAREGVLGVTVEGLRIAQPEVEQDGAPVVMLLGSDLAWGSDDEPSATAAGILSEAGYIVHNLATPRAPHSQWPLLLNAYIERLRPHAVVVLVDVARDFEAPVPITPQQQPYYETNVGFLPAIDRQGNRLTFTQAVNEHERRIAGHYPMLQSMAEHSVLAYTLVERLTFAGMATWDVAALVESLELTRITAEKQGAQFIVALVGKAPAQTFASQQNARAQNVLATFEPTYLERPNATVTVRRAQTQRKLAPWLAALLADRQLPPPRPKVLERYQRSEHDGLSWELWSMSLSLDMEQGAAIRGVIDRLKDDIVQLFRESPADSSDTPLQQMADQARGGEADAVESFLQEASPEGTEATYSERMEAYESQAREEIIDLLDMRQRVAFAELDFGALMSISTGHDPLGDAVQHLLIHGVEGEGASASKVVKDSLPFEDFVAHLNLSAAEAAEARRILDNLKDAFLEVLSRPTKDGQSSPLAHVASRLREEGADAEAALSTYMAQHEDGDTGKPYTDALLANEVAARDALTALLGEEKAQDIFSLPIAALMHVDTGYDPMGAWLEAQYREAMDGRASRAEVERWKRLAAPLDLSEEDEAALIAAVNQLKESIAVLLFTPPSEDDPAPGALLAREQAADNPEAIERFAAYADEQQVPGLDLTYNARMKQLDDQTREALEAMLNEEQLKELDQLPYVLLSDIPTGYDPFGERMRTFMYDESGE